MVSRLENVVRRIIRTRMRRGQRDAVAQAAGHPSGTWVTNWMKGRQKHATLDELAAMLEKVEVPLARITEAPDEADDVDWEVFGLMRHVPKELKVVARGLVAGLCQRQEAERLPIETPAPRPHPVARKASGKH